MKTQEIITRIQKEIEKTKNLQEKTTQLVRLKEIMVLYMGEDQVVSFEELSEKLKNQTDVVKITTGWTKLDEIIKGFRLQQLIVVSAFTKHGKTSWLMDLTTKIAKFNPLWFPFEEGAEELMTKFIERGEKPPHGFVPAVMKGNTFEWIEEKIIEGIVKYGSQVIFIDQLDFIVPMNGDNHALRVGQAVRNLKNLAKKWNICIFLICHLSKVDMTDNPTLESLKGSSSIAQEADTVILLWRETKREKGEIVTTNNTNISVQANRRHGTTGNVKMVYDNGHYTEIDWKRTQGDDDYDNF